jgi:hypothetical protein
MSPVLIRNMISTCNPNDLQAAATAGDANHPANETGCRGASAMLRYSILRIFLDSLLAAMQRLCHFHNHRRLLLWASPLVLR